MTTTPLWSIPEVAPSQDQKETTINNALVWLEGALADEYDGIAWTSDAFTLGNNAFTQHLTFKCPDNPSASSTLTVPLLKKFFIVNNGLGSRQVTVKGATGASVVVPSATVAILLCDGTDIFTTTALAATSGVLSLGGASGAIGVTGNIGVGGGTLTLTGMAAEAIPTAGFLVSDGTHVAAGAVTGNLAFTGGTLSLTGMAAESVPAAGAIYSTGTHIAHLALSTDFVLSAGSLSLTGIEHTASKNASNGYAGLDAGGRVAFAQLPTSLADALVFAGTWNAASNSPALASGTDPNPGGAASVYVVVTPGTTTLDGYGQWFAGDKAIFDKLSGTWERIEGEATSVYSVGGASGAIGVTGNLSVVGGTLTLAGMAAQAVPAAGIIYSNGTAVSALTVTSGVAQSGGTLSPASIAAHSLLMNTGTSAAAPTATAISGNLTDAGGTLDLAAQQRLTSVFISHPGTMDNAELLMLVGVSASQHLRVPANLAGTTLVFNAGTSGSGWPAATTTAVLSTLHAGSWTAQGTITISTAGSLTLPTFSAVDLTTGGDGVRLVGQATADTGFKDFCLTVVLEKIA